MKEMLNESPANNDNYIAYENAANWIGVSHVVCCMLSALCRIIPGEPQRIVSQTH